VRDKVCSLDDAVARVRDGARLGVGGVLLQRKPIAFLCALVAAGRRDLTLCSFLASLDAELLAAHGALAAAEVGYVGFEHLGFAPAYSAAVDRGDVTVREHSEFLFVTGLRAALAGLPFLPTKAAAGSQVLAELGFAEITCPYTGTPLVAVPALVPDVAVLHAEAADRRGNVVGPARRDFLFDFDANLARAAKQVVVTVERVLDDVSAERRRTLLFGYEVDAVVEVPRGAAPTGLPGRYPADLAAVRRYLGEAGDDARAALQRLVAA